MKKSAYFALIFLAAACAHVLGAGSTVVTVPPDVQHFGPLLVVAFHDDSPNPETYRGDLFSEKADARMHLLRAIGIEAVPELHEIWSGFLLDHAGEDQNKVIAQFISGGMLDWNFGEPGSKQVVLFAGFDETTEHPLETDAVFNLKDRRWTHVATLACRCQMGDEGDPFGDPRHPLPKQEWVISLDDRNDSIGEYRSRELRFRLRGGVLWPLIDFVRWSTVCPLGSSYGPKCNVAETSLEPAKLMGNNDNVISGFVLITRNGTSPPCDKCGLILYNPKCSSYLWDEQNYSYQPTSYKPVNCGPANKSSHRAAVTNKTSLPAAPN